MESIGEILKLGRCRDRGKYNWEWAVASPQLKLFRLLDGVEGAENIRDLGKVGFGLEVRGGGL